MFDGLKPRVGRRRSPRCCRLRWVAEPHPGATPHWRHSEGAGPCLSKDSLISRKLMTTPSYPDISWQISWFWSWKPGHCTCDGVLLSRSWTSRVEPYRLMQRQNGWWGHGGPTNLGISPNVEMGINGGWWCSIFEHGSDRICWDLH